MKTTPLLVVVSLFTGGSLFSAPFDTSQVARDTKWLAHLDVEKFKQSTFGTFLIDTAKGEMDKKKELPISLNIDAILQEIRSITAYGTTFEDQPENHSVLIIKAGEKAQAIVDGFLASQEVSTEGKAPFKTLTGKAFPSHLIGNEVYLTFPRKDLIVISKEYSQIEQAMSVIEGRAPKLAKGSPMLASPDPSGFFFIASSEGLNSIKNIPPQARILQKATGARVAFGEKAGNLLANIALSTTGADVSSQLRRIIDGMLALVSFAQVENESFAKLTQNITVSDTENSVAVNLSYPVDDLKKLLLALVESRGKIGGSASRKDGPRQVKEIEVNDAIGGERLKVVNVDASSDDGNMARNAADNKLDTFWRANGKNAWIRFELEQSSLVREVQLAWRRGNNQRTQFSIQTSPDGRAWTTLIRRTSAGNPDQTDLESWNVPDTATRWIRIMGPGFPGNAVTTLLEARFLGQPGVTVTLPTQPEAAAAAPGRN